MWDFVQNLFQRLTSDAYDLAAVGVELLLIGLAVNWCASILQGTRGMRLLRGLLVVLVAATLVVRVLSVQYSWTRLDLLYRYFISGLAVMALLAFQPELRRAIIRAGDVRFMRRKPPQSRTIAALVESAGFLSRKHYGALIAVQREVGLRSWAENGTTLNAEVSANLLNSIFFPNSPLHDLGVIIQDTKVLAASCQFPQAESEDLDSTLGSRHRAAIGLSSESDALVLVVSEETGTISIADSGNLRRYLSLDELRDELTTRLAGQAGRNDGDRRPLRDWGLSDWWRILRRLLIVAPITLVIWYLADQASQLNVDNVEVEIAVQHGAEWDTRVLEPDSGVFRTSFRGSTRAIEQLKSETTGRRLRVDWTLPEVYEKPGPQSVPVGEIIERSPQVRARGLTLVSVAPQTILFEVDEVINVRFPVRAESGKVRVGEANFTPHEVLVAIRRSDHDRLTAEQRFVTARVQERLANVPRDQVHTLNAVRVEPTINGVALLRLDPAEVTAKLRIVSERIKRPFSGIAVAVQISPPLEERYDVVRADTTEWVIDLEIAGDKPLVDALRKEEIRAYVNMTSQLIVPDPRPAEVTVVLPPGLSVEGPVRTVLVRLRERAAGSP